MAGMAILVASLLVTPVRSSSAMPQPPAVTVEKHTFLKVVNPMANCRKMEASYHSGQGESSKHGNKTVSRQTNQSGEYVYETTTFCVEI